MTINEIFDRILLRSGQFILRKSKIDIDPDNFRILVEDALAKYSGYVPHTYAHPDLDLNASRSFTFPEDYEPTLKVAPDWLSEVTPVSSFGSIGGVFVNRESQQNRYGTDSELINPVLAPWDFNKRTKVLTVPYSSFYNVISVYHHRVQKIEGEEEYEVRTMDIQQHNFFKLLQGMFLQGIGRSRRAFTLSDLPILMDADTLVSEGENIVEKTEEKLQNDQRFYLSSC